MTIDIETLQEILKRKRSLIESLGARNEALEAELKELKEANDFLREHAEAQAKHIEDLPELWAETAKLKHALAQAEHMAGLWKRLAGIKYSEAELYKESANLERSCVMQLVAELSALKKDARICAELAVGTTRSRDLADCIEAARRILEATKEEP